MSLSNPAIFLVDTNGDPVGTPSNVLYTTGSVAVQGTVPVSGSVVVSNTVSVTGSVALSQPVTTTPQQSATAFLTSSNAQVTSLQVLPANASRLGAILVNDSTKIAYVAFGTSASTTNFTYRILPQGVIELSNTVFTGAIHAIWAGTGGAIRITELT